MLFVFVAVGWQNNVLNMGSGSLAQLQKYIPIMDIDATVLFHVFLAIAEARTLRYVWHHYKKQDVH